MTYSSVYIQGALSARGEGTVNAVTIDRSASMESGCGIVHPVDMVDAVLPAYAHTYDTENRSLTPKLL